MHKNPNFGINLKENMSLRGLLCLMPNPYNDLKIYLWPQAGGKTRIH